MNNRDVIILNKLFAQIPKKKKKIICLILVWSDFELCEQSAWRCHLVSAPDPDSGRLLLLAWWVMARTAMPRHSFSISWSSISLWGVRTGANPLRKSYCPYKHKTKLLTTLLLIPLRFNEYPSDIQKPPWKQKTWNLTIIKETNVQ